MPDTRLIEALRTTLLELEESIGISSDHPAMISLKGILLRRIADLEAERDSPSEQPAD